MFTRKPRLQLEKFAINGAKRLLQHNLPTAVVSGCSNVMPKLRFAVRNVGHVLFILRSRDQTALAVDASTILRGQRGLNIIDALPWR